MLNQLPPDPGIPQESRSRRLGISRLGPHRLAAGVGAKTSPGSVLPGWIILFNATLPVRLAGFCLVAAIWRELKPGHDSPRRSDLRRLPAALLVAVHGGLLPVPLWALFGIWSARTGGP